MGGMLDLISRQPFLCLNVLECHETGWTHWAACRVYLSRVPLGWAGSICAAGHTGWLLGMSM